MTGLPPYIPDTVGYKAPPVLLPYQQRRMADVSPLKVIEKSRRTGIMWAKTSNSVLTATSSAPAGGVNVHYITYNQDMTVEYIQACTMWARTFNYAASEIEEGFWEEDDDDKHIRTYIIKSPDPSFRIVALSSCPSNLRGRQGIIVIGEVMFHKRLDELLKAALAILIWGREIHVISTHGGDDNPFNTPIGDIRARRQGGNVRRITFREAVSKGLFRRVCLRIGKEWSGASEQAWMASAYEFYGAGASEKLDCILADSGGARLSRALMESRISAGTLVLRLTCRGDYELLSDEVHSHEAQGWPDEHLRPLLEMLPVGVRSFLGRNFGRNGDLSVDYPLLQEKNLIRRVPFILELRNVPFRQQEQITWYLMDGLPGLLGAASDARGNDAYLAEYAIQCYGSDWVQQVMPTEDWHRRYIPPVKAALEDGNLVDLPKDEDTLGDLQAIQVVNGIPRVSEQRSKAKADGGKHHEDSVIALALAYFASREINRGPVKVSSRRHRQTTRMLKEF